MTRGARRGKIVWAGGALLLSGLILLPLAAIVFLAATPEDPIWPHLAATVLPIYLTQTAALMGGVGVLTFLTGTAAAWLVTMYQFPLRRFFAWALVLPLAFPTYIIAYTYVHVFEYAGPVQTALRGLMGWSLPDQYMFPEIRTLGGAIIVFSLVLFPYVFLTARASFLRQSASQLDVARTLGTTPLRAFLSIGLPLARPAIAGGVGLAMMECLNDIGAVEFFGVRTLSLGIYTTWLGKGNLAGAAQLAVVMLAFVLIIIVCERSLRAGDVSHGMSTRERPFGRIRLEGAAAWLTATVCFLPLLFGFLLPAAVLLAFALADHGQIFERAFLTAAINSVGVAAIAAVAAVMAGIFIAYAQKIARTRPVNAAAWLVTAGYAMPGAVLGLGVLVPLAALDNGIDGLMRDWFGRSTGLLLTGSVAALVFAYLVRFLAVSLGAFEAGLARITPNLSHAARTLGRGPLRILLEVDLPLLRPAFFTAALLVFVETMKELSATLVLRPFNFETLATLVYAEASLDQLEQTGLAALTIVAAGLVPVFVLSRMIAASVTKAAKSNKVVST
jgi:iron(III) transport system permease protein